MIMQIFNPRVAAFIALYRAKIGSTPTPEQAILLWYFEMAGNELPIYGGRHYFYKAWRQHDVLPSQCGLGSRDMVVWHLIAMDPLVDEVVTALIPEFEVPTYADDF